MLVSHDFNRRLLGSQGIQPPMLKDEVTDDTFTSIICTVGSHQRLISISQCNNIRPGNLKLLGLCTSLQYLDISYTRLADISIIASNCQVLKSLQLSGLYLDTYIPLGSMISLELLNLRRSYNHDLFIAYHLF